MVGYIQLSPEQSLSFQKEIQFPQDHQGPSKGRVPVVGFRSSKMASFKGSGYLGLVVSTHLKNMRKSNGIVSPSFGVKIKQCLKPPSGNNKVVPVLNPPKKKYTLQKLNLDTNNDNGHI